jgi:hypothetical protein
MTKDWLQARTTLEAAEQENLVQDARLGPTAIPFGYQHDAWVRFKALMQDGDELWTFSSPPEFWEALMGRAGLCIVRKGDVVASLVTMLS